MTTIGENLLSASAEGPAPPDILISILEAVAMARKSRETERPARGKRRNAGTPAPRTPPKKKRSPVVTFVAVVVVVVTIWATLIRESGKIPSGKIAPDIVAELDKLYMFCGVYWMEKGGHLPCGQKLADKLRDTKDAGIKVTVISGVRKDFSAIGKHIAAPMVFRVDDDGEVFIKAKECEINIRSLDLHELDLEEVESQCKPK